MQVYKCFITFSISHASIYTHGSIRIRESINAHYCIALQAKRIEKLFYFIHSFRTNWWKIHCSREKVINDITLSKWLLGKLFHQTCMWGLGVCTQKEGEEEEEENIMNIYDNYVFMKFCEIYWQALFQFSSFKTSSPVGLAFVYMIYNSSANTKQFHFESYRKIIYKTVRNKIHLSTNKDLLLQIYLVLYIIQLKFYFCCFLFFRSIHLKHRTNTQQTF